MVPARIRRYIRTGALLAVVASTAGCPIPLPSGYTTSSRENISAEVTVQLEAGVTTREAVLLLLGEPDGTGPDDAWLAYGSVYGEGGVVFVICAGGNCGGTGSEKMEYRRLVVSFDEHGLMTNAEFVNRACREGIIGMGSGRFKTRCLGVACSGISVPDALEPRLRAVETMRAAEKCSTARFNGIRHD